MSTFLATLLLQFLVFSLIGPLAAQAAPALTITPITWDVVGLDSNDQATGPAEFSVGARICNVGDQPATNLTTEFVWDSVNALIGLTGSPTVNLSSLDAGDCHDVYYAPSVQRTAAAFDTARSYHISVTADGLGSVSTPSPRQIYVERLISQNRNEVQSITGQTNVVVGGTYTYTIQAKTATQGYEQLTTFVPFASDIFEVTSVSATYSAPPGGTNDSIYADACGWDPDPTSPTYLECIGPLQYPGGKAGGSVTLIYNVRVVGPGAASLSPVIYDFSGSSFHYNSDYGTAVLAVTASAGSPPLAIDDDVAITEDTPRTFDALDNDSDPDGNLDLASLTATSSPTNGTLNQNPGGTFTYTPDADYTGSDSFTYEVCDDVGLCDTATVMITVNPVNDPPIATNDTTTVDEDNPVTIPVLDNDNDVDGDTLTVLLVSPPAHGALTINPDGTVTYTPDLDYSGIDTFVYEACDPGGLCDTAIVTVTVNPVNDPPAAADDLSTTDEDVAVTVPVLDNDSDVDGTLDPATVTMTSGPTNGTITGIDALSGEITYLPDFHFHGADTFTYQVCDNDGACNTAVVNVTVNSLNDPPVATDDVATINEDTPIDVPALDNDTDPDGDSLTVVLVSDPAHGNTSINPDGTIAYSPDPDYAGPDSFEYEVCDPDGLCDTALVTVTVSPVNDPPVATDDSYSTDENTPMTVPAPGVLAGDTDVDGDALTAGQLTNPSNGTLTFNPDGSFTYTPDPGFTGPDSFTYEACDPSAQCDPATVTVQVRDVASAPIGMDETTTTGEDTAVVISVLGNDSDPDVGDTLTVTSVTDPANGTATINPDWTVTYTPDPDYHGTDAFTYEVCDQVALCDTATVNITVTDVNDPPLAADDLDSTDEDVAVTIDVLHDDTDADGVLVPGSVTVTIDAVNGTAVANPDGTITYTPDPDFSGTDTFEYQVCDDDGACDTALVTMQVAEINDPPSAVGDSTSTNEDTPVIVPVLDNDTDPDGDPLTVDTVTNPAHGTAVINPDGTVTYTPDPDFSGPDNFTYQVCDPSGACDSAAVIVIDVAPVNDDPDARDDLYSTEEDTPITVSAPGLLTNDSDIEGDPLNVSGTTQPANGTVSANADGTFTYTPNPDFNGTDTFTYTVSDGNGGTDTATVAITVGAVNDDPVAVDDIAATPEDTPVTITALGNDTDPDGDPLATVSATNPANGTAAINPDGTITYTPDTGYSGTDTFSYTIEDLQGGVATATVSVSVAAINDPPVAVDDVYSGLQDTTLVVGAPGLLANDSDPDGDPVTVTGYTQPANGSVTVSPDGSFTYTPDAGYAGPDAFTYTISDGNGGTDIATVDLTIDAVNSPPVAADDPYTTSEDAALVVPAPGVLGNDTDTDGDTLSVTGYTQPTNGSVTVTPDGSFTYTPDPNFNGTDTFTYTADDSFGGTDTATVTITVTPANDPPTAVDDNDTTPEDTPVTIPVLTNDSDIDGDPLATVSVTQPTNGTAIINPDGTITYTPDPNFNGTDTFTYTADDSFGGTDTATVTITVTPVNDPPTAVDDNDTTPEDTPVTIPLPGVIGNDTDPDGGPLTVVAYTQPSSGAVTVNPDGSFTYTPDPSFAGTDTFTYTISDGNGGTDTATVIITVGAVNDPPAAEDDTATTEEDAAVTIPVLGNDTDADGDPLTVQSVTQPPNGTVLINPDGTVTYTPDANFHGVETVTYTLSDGNGGTDTATVVVTVNSVNDAPAAIDDFDTTDQDTPVVIDVLVNDSDVDGDGLTVISTIAPANGAVLTNPDGTVTYAPDTGFTGVDTFFYSVSDGNGSTTNATVTITVAPVNNPPVFTDAPTNTSQTVAVGGAFTPLTGTDPDGDPYTYVLSGGIFPPGVSLNPDGSFSGSPTTTGTSTSTITICDIHGLCSTSILTLLVQAQLPRTGADSDLLAIYGLVLVFLGSLLVAGSRRRRTSDTR